jgi:hypothetical protein
MASYKNSRTLPTILTVIVIIVAIAGLVALARFLFFSGSTTSTTVDTSRDELLSSVEGKAVRMTVRGPIVADENFRSYQMTISPSSRDITTYTGYLGTVLERRTLGNNVAAYEEFVHALDKANFVAGQPLEGAANDVRGICATGRVTEFSLMNNGQPTETLWTSTCGGSKGSLRANVDQLSQLFNAQIPETPTLLSNIAL